MVGNQDVFLERALIDEGLLTTDQVEAARRFSSEHNTDFVDALIQSETLSSRQILLIKSDICEVPFVEISDFEPCYTNTSLVPRNIAERHRAFPLFMVDGVLTLAMDDPLNLEATDQIRQIAKCEVDAVLADREQIVSLIGKAYSLGYGTASGVPSATEVEVDAEDDESSQPVVAAVNQILADAVQQRASDIHINPDEHDMHLRYRVDGVLQSKQGPPLSMHAGIVQRLKVMAHLDLTQTRRPQDGKFRFRHGGRNVDVRMSTVPTVCGENAVLRLLTNAQTFQDFHDLGIPVGIISDLEQAIKQPHGIILVTGPTGSGKTTTLYTALNKLNNPARNIMTIEDPVEIRLPYIRQIEVNHDIGLNFATALRSILRQDPDVVLVGEIRDDETATIALQSALTGHLVLSTLHTNDAVGAISRLFDFKLPPFIITSSVLGVLAQRLVRRVCQHCAQSYEPDELIRRQFSLVSKETGFIHGRGCARCGHTGFRGRIGLYEYLEFTPQVQSAIAQGGGPDAIRSKAQSHGLRPMWQDGLAKALLGLTTLEEVAKVVSIVRERSTDERLSA